MEVGICHDKSFGVTQLRVHSKRNIIQNAGAAEKFQILILQDCFMHFSTWPFTAKTYGKGLGSWK